MLDKNEEFFLLLMWSRYDRNGTHVHYAYLPDHMVSLCEKGLIEINKNPGWTSPFIVNFTPNGLVYARLLSE